MAFSLEYTVPASRERVVEALRQRAAHWRESEMPAGLRANGVLRVELRLSDDAFALFCPTNRRPSYAWYDLRGQITPDGPDRTIVRVRAGLVRRPTIVYALMALVTLFFVATGDLAARIVIPAFVFLAIALDVGFDRGLAPGNDPAADHLVERFQTAMTSLGGTPIAPAARMLSSSDTARLPSNER